MTNTFDFSFERRTSDSSGKRPPSDPLRILIVADLGGTRQSRTAADLATRPFQKMDVDEFETYLSDENPSLALSDSTLSVREMEDFHPDQVLQAVPAMQALIDLRSRLKSPATFESAASEVRGMLGATDSTAAAAAESDSDTMRRLLGGVVPQDAPTQTPKSAVDAMIQQAVADHVTPSADPKAEQYIKAVEAALADHLRAVLHDRAFQSTEAAWRGLELLVSRIETDETLSLHVWNASKTELIEALGTAETSPDDTVLHHRLVRERAEKPFVLIVPTFAFAAQADDIRLLATLGAMAGRTDAVVLASVEFGLVQTQDWDALRESGMAQHIAAFAPRFLLRQPYGKGSDPIGSFAFTEITAPERPDGYLWGAGSIAGAVIIANAFSDGGWSAALNTSLHFDDLPFVYYDAGGEQVMKPCAEVEMSDTEAEAVLATGTIPLIAVRNQNAVRLPQFRTLSNAASGGAFGPFAL